MLHKTRIKTLELSHVEFISCTILNSFGQLRDLRSLSIRLSGTGKKVQVHGNGLVQMMNTAKSLKHVYFDELQLFGDDDGLDFLNKEINRYKATNKNRSRKVNCNTIVLEPV